MALPTSTSCLFSATLAVLTLAAMMAFKSQLASKEWLTIVGGFLGSQFFIFLVTAVGNFERMTFGKNFQTKLVPESLYWESLDCMKQCHRLSSVLPRLRAIFSQYGLTKFYCKLYIAWFLYYIVVFCLMSSMFVSGLVHRVCVTTCFIFSCIVLYYLVRLSNAKYGPVAKPVQVSGKGKKSQ